MTNAIYFVFNGGQCLGIYDSLILAKNHFGVWYGPLDWIQESERIWIPCCWDLFDVEIRQINFKINKFAREN